MPEVPYDEIRARVLSAIMDENRGTSDHDGFFDKLSDSVSILISTYNFNKISFTKNVNKIKTEFFSYNGLHKTKTLKNLYSKLNVVDETLMYHEIMLNEIKSTRQIPKHVAIIVYKRDKGLCVNCKSKGVGGLLYKIHKDHRYPFSKHGTSLTPENIRLLCMKCNIKKSGNIE